jgi:hypothetical protein
MPIEEKGKGGMGGVALGGCERAQRAVRMLSSEGARKD